MEKKEDSRYELVTAYYNHKWQVCIFDKIPGQIYTIFDYIRRAREEVSDDKKHMINKIVIGNRLTLIRKENEFVVPTFRNVNITEDGQRKAEYEVWEVIENKALIGTDEKGRPIGSDNAPEKEKREVNEYISSDPKINLLRMICLSDKCNKTFYTFQKIEQVMYCPHCGENKLCLYDTRERAILIKQE